MTIDFETAKMLAELISDMDDNGETLYTKEKEFFNKLLDAFPELEQWYAKYVL